MIRIEHRHAVDPIARLLGSAPSDVETSRRLRTRGRDAVGQRREEVPIARHRVAGKIGRGQQRVERVRIGCCRRHDCDVHHGDDRETFGQWLEADVEHERALSRDQHGDGLGHVPQIPDGEPLWTRRHRTDEVAASGVGVCQSFPIPEHDEHTLQREPRVRAAHHAGDATEWCRGIREDQQERERREHRGHTPRKVQVPDRICGRARLAASFRQRLLLAPKAGQLHRCRQPIEVAPLFRTAKRGALCRAPYAANISCRMQSALASVGAVSAPIRFERRSRSAR